MKNLPRFVCHKMATEEFVAFEQVIDLLKDPEHAESQINAAFHIVANASLLSRLEEWLSDSTSELAREQLPVLASSCDEAAKSGKFNQVAYDLQHFAQSMEQQKRATITLAKLQTQSVDKAIETFQTSLEAVIMTRLPSKLPVVIEAFLKKSFQSFQQLKQEKKRKKPAESNENRVLTSDDINAEASSDVEHSDNEAKHDNQTDDEDENMANNEDRPKSKNDRLQPQLSQFANMLTNLSAIGLSVLLEWSCSKLLEELVKSHVHKLCSETTDRSVLKVCRTWLNDVAFGWIERIQLSKCLSSVALERLKGQLPQQLYSAIARERIEQLFNIIVDYPDSKPAIRDLKAAMELSNQRQYLIQSLRATFERRLLHPGAATSDILSQYVNTIKTLRELDSTGVCLEKVGDPVRSYLRSREDTIRCIVTSLTGEQDLADELQDGEPKLIFADEGENEMSDYEDDNWTPDPVDADLSKSSSSRRSADIISKLVSIYGSKDVFVREYQNLLADRLVALTDYDTDKELRSLELLKLRFGEGSLHSCEVMLKDIADSKRIDNLIHKDIKTDASITEIPIHAQVLSRLFWPTLRTEEINIPTLMDIHAKQYEQAFVIVKPQRKLQWIHSLGSVQLTLTFSDRTLSLSVPPIQAAIISAFDSRESAMLNELALELGQSPTALQRRLAFWISQGVLKEDPPGTYKVIEVAAAGSSSLQEADDMEEEATEAGIGNANQETSSADEALWWSYIVGMLTNLGSLPADRIHTMLKMFVQAPNRFEINLEQLQSYLGKLLREDKLTFSGGVYRLK